MFIGRIRFGVILVAAAALFTDPAQALQEQHPSQATFPQTASFLIPSFFSALELKLSTLARLPERLVAGRTPTVAETAELKTLLGQYNRQSDLDRLTLLEQYLQKHLDSPWRLALRLNLGQLQFQQGYYERAMQAYHTAWHDGQQDAAHEPRLIALRDAAAGKLLLMYASLGDRQRLQAMLNEIGPQPLYGAAGQAQASARGGLWHMLNNWREAYRCGPAALASIVEAAQRGIGASTPAIAQVTRQGQNTLGYYPAGQDGISMDEEQALAQKAGMDMVALKRVGQAPIPLPAVVHWKVGHYAAVVGQREQVVHGQKRTIYHIIDPTFGREQWISQQALDSESSGMFLVPAGAIGTTGWQQVAQADLKQIYGRGYLTNPDPNDTGPDAPCTSSCCHGGGGAGSGSGSGSGTGSGSSSGSGMCAVTTTLPHVSLRLYDTPVGYTPPVGRDVHTTLTYNQREASQPASMDYGNVGPQWSINWIGYIEDNPSLPGASVRRVAAGGGAYDYTGYNSATGAFTREMRTPAAHLSQPDGRPPRQHPHPEL